MYVRSGVPAGDNVVSVTPVSRASETDVGPRSTVKVLFHSKVPRELSFTLKLTGASCSPAIAEQPPRPSDASASVAQPIQA